MSAWRKMLVGADTSLVGAIRIIDQGGGQIAIVVDADDRLLGVITDADIRKAIVRGMDLQEACSSIMTATPIAMPASSSRTDQLELMRRRHIRQVPLVDGNGKVVDVALLMDLVAANYLPNAAVIMAGGLGTRLGTLTANAPKPLLHVGGKPLLETIIRQLIDQGFSRFFLSVNYRAQMIIEHFGDGSQWGVEIGYLREHTRLGTAGALHLLPPGIEHDILVMNGDILTKVDARHLLAMHSANAASVTMAVKDYVHNVPYGVVELDDNSNVTGFREKPSHRYFVNAGIYVLSPRVLPLIPSAQYFDMPALFEAVRAGNLKLCAFPIREYWMDIGHPEDYEQANVEFVEHFAASDNTIAMQSPDDAPT